MPLAVMVGPSEFFGTGERVDEVDQNGDGNECTQCVVEQHR
jgi:hypothetical protein